MTVGEEASGDAPDFGSRSRPASDHLLLSPRPLRLDAPFISRMERANVRFDSPLAREVERVGSDSVVQSLEDDDVSEDPGKVRSPERDALTRPPCPESSFKA